MSPIPAQLESALAGRYAIERELGEGGMAVVYLAQDLRHHRKVAVKVLRPELAAVIGADRFLAEIRTTANLQHPHILPLFDSGVASRDAAGLDPSAPATFLYYVMPYVEGENLRDRLTREKQLPIPDVVRIAKEVASALDYAHRHGVIHRDIKPENIMLHDGQALVADFGIALAASKAGTNSRMTETGMSLGTPHYMSPEQAMGEREVTARSDIYALGAITYEMLVGEPPFTGPTVQAIVAKVLTEEPRPLLPKRHTIPPHIESVVMTALEKLAADRFASAAEFAAALENPGLARTAAVAAPARSPGRSLPLERLAMPLLVATATLTLLSAWLLFGRRPPALPLARYAIGFPAAQTPLALARPVLSPDGSKIVYLGPPAERPQLWIKLRDRATATPLPGTVGAGAFAFSPDGQSIAFMQNQQLRKLSLGGGSATVLGDSGSQQWPGVAWSGEEVVYVHAAGRGLRSVPAAGGESHRILDADSAVSILPVALPGNRFILFTRCRGGVCGVEQDLWALNLGNRETRRLLPGVASAEYSTSGHLVYVRRDGVMVAAPFDPKTATLKGEGVPVQDSVVVAQGIVPLFSISQTGTLLMREGSPIEAADYDMVFVDRSGRETVIDSTWTVRHIVQGANAGWALSPDGRRLAIGLATGTGDDVWVKQLPTGPLSRISFDTAAEFRPRWMPDGRTVMFSSLRDGANNVNIYRRAADGTGADTLFFDYRLPIFEVALTPDRRWLVFRPGGVVNQIGNRDIYAIRPGVDTAPVPLMASAEFDEAALALSPDGRWLAYESNETGRREVYLRPFPGVDALKVQVSTSGGAAPLWSRNGRELFFVTGNRRMASRTVRTAPELELGEPTILFPLHENIYLTATENYTPHDITADGRFVMARRRQQAGVEQPLVLTENWVAELRQRVRK